jgi:hypothetical protein
MADITNVQVVRFSNERARTMADAIVSLSAKVDAWLADWTAQAISAAITADSAGASANVADGSETDGRQRVTGTELTNFRAALIQVQTALTTTLVSGVGATVKAIADGIQVNGSAR